jgi:protein O-GlcNAc transferase
VNRGGFPAPAQNPRGADAMLKLREAIALHQQGRTAEAESRYSEILQQFPDQPDALHFLGVIESQRGKHDKALQLMDRSIAAHSRNPASHYNRANLLRDMGRLDEALWGYDAALALNGKHISALINRADLLRVQERYAESLETCERAIAVAPDNASAHYGRGMALRQLNRFNDAISAFDRAIALAPDKPEFLIERGHALCRAGRFADGLANFETAITKDPKNPNAFFGRAGALMELRRFADAVASYDRARALDPAWIETLYGRASALIELERYEEAIADFRRLLAARPDYPYALGMMVHAQNMSCDWSDESSANELRQCVRDGKKAASPFALLQISDSPEEMLQCARIVMRDKFEPGREPLWRGEIYRHQRIRLAYVSADLRAHPVGQLMSGVIEAHDRAGFEVIAVSYGADDGSELRQRLKRTFERFIDAELLSDFEIARLIRQMEIDIAVDLPGLTASCRPGILTLRAAPVQVNYLGYAGSLGARNIDYILADRIVIPEQQQKFYDEKTAWLPPPFLPFPARSTALPVSRAEAGLPERGFVFACFNSSYKINQRMFSIWMRLLAQVDGSVLWLGRTNTTATANLRTEAERHGIAAYRVIFAPRVPTAEQHLARLALADLFLDTLPYNAHSTAADALSAGVPVLTCRGESFAGRVAASLVTAAGIAEFITANLQEYEARALALTTDRAALESARRKLRSGSIGQPGWTAGFTRNLETAYRQMWLRAQQGLPPESFSIAADVP